ncbi:MAG: shikimate kinase AroK [Gammaproteobacteria bacterium]|nr:MAG: shikimate kinase AroK [Gammaproteobacteria bacterium]
MPSSNNIIFIGPMGAGKTTVGRALASQLKWDFVDSDQEIEARTGANVAWIFDVEGEGGFRDREQAVIEELTQRQSIVIATGGGAVLRPINRERLKARGTVIYLTASVEQILARTLNDRSRPLLQTDDRAGVLTSLLEKRDPLYRETADLIIPTGDGPPREIIAQVLDQIQSKLSDSANFK